MTLCDNVAVVIHSAATVKFDEKLKLSINVNVCGTQRMISLCKKMKKLVVSFFSSGLHNLYCSFPQA